MGDVLPMAFLVKMVTKSFAEVLGGSKPTSIALKSPSTHRGEPAMFFTSEDIVSLSSPFQYALIGKFSHGRPAISKIKSALDSIGLKAGFTVGLLDRKHILMRFNHEEDYHHVWLKELWYLKRFPMRVFKWTLDFWVDMESTIEPIWVNFQGLPIHFFAKSSLFSIRSTLGVPMKMDTVTAELTRPSVARMCIDMDLLKKFLGRIWIGSGETGYWQKVTYERVPKYCAKCCGWNE